ncbi:MAG: hypothetical protein WA869_00045 [Alloacidobacterium sp.]
MVNVAITMTTVAGLCCDRVYRGMGQSDGLCGGPRRAPTFAIQATLLSLAIELEGRRYGRLRSSEDFREGVEAFGAKRKPSFRGR